MVVVLERDSNDSEFDCDDDEEVVVEFVGGGVLLHVVVFDSVGV